MLGRAWRGATYRYQAFYNSAQLARDLTTLHFGNIVALYPNMNEDSWMRRGATGQAGSSSAISEHERGCMGETRSDRFRRLAQARGDRLIREISLLGNLANRKNYDYTPEEVEQLFEPIERELREVQALFDPDAPSTRKVKFK